VGEGSGMRDMSKIKTQLAKEFRKAPTKSEKIMWNTLRNRQFINLKFRRQHLIAGYIVDFYCSELALTIEIDGSVHQNQIREDRERQKIIENLGIIFFRVGSKEVEEDINKILKKLKKFISLSHGR